MKKIIATCVADIDTFPLDCFSISHFNGGIIAYYIAFWILEFFLIPLTACHIASISVMIGSIFWEIIENTILVNMKRNKRCDSAVNTQTDTLLVFLGEMVGLATYNTDWIFKIILIGSLFLAYTTTRILTELNSKKRKKFNKNEKSVQKT